MKQHIILSWIALLLFICPGCNQKAEILNIKQEQSEKFTDEAIECFKRGEYEKGIQKSSKAIELNPKNVRAYENRASMYYTINKLELALDDINEAIKLQPEAKSQYILKASILLDLKKYQECSEVINIVQKRDANNKIILLTKASLVAGWKNDYSNSLVYINKYINEVPNPYYGYYRRSDIYYEMGEYEKAKKDALTVLKMNPSIANSYAMLAKCYNKLGKPDIAEENSIIFLKIVGSDLRFKKDYDEIGQLLNALNNRKSQTNTSKLSDKSYLKTISNKFVNKSAKLFMDNKFKNSSFELYASLKIYPDNENAYYTKSIMLTKLKKLDKAEKNIDKAISLSPKNSSYFHFKSIILFLRKNYPESLIAINRAIELDPEMKESYLTRADLMYIWKKDYTSALKDVNEYVKEFPQAYQGYTVRAKILYETGEYNKSIKDAQKALEIHPENYVSLKTIGDCYDKLGEKKKAKQYFDKYKSKLSQIKNRPNDNVEINKKLKDVITIDI